MRAHLTNKRAHDSQESDLSDSDLNLNSFPATKKMQTPTPGQSSPPHPGPGLDPGTCHLKILIPSAAAGAIIGKGGETIAEVQQKIGAKVKLSKANDFYPGTNERVCLISGSKDAVTDICAFVQEKVREKPDPHSKPAIDFDNKMTAEREKQIKVIVPNSTAGMIIGKGGCTIQQIKETSGSFIQLSQKPSDTTLPERVVTVIGDDDSNKVALEMILVKIQEDPQSGSCLNVSYSDINGPVANANPTGSPFANGQQQLALAAPAGVNAPGHGPRTLEGPAGPEDGGQKAICAGPGLESASGPGGGGVNLSVPGYSNVNIKLNIQTPQPPSDPRIISQCLPHINHSLRRSGYSDKVADEVTGAMGTLSIHGVLQLTPTNPDLGSGPVSVTDPVFLPPPPQTPPVNTAANQGPFGPAGLVPAPPPASQQVPPPVTVGVPGFPPRPASPGSSLISPLAAISGHTVAQFPPLPVNNNSFGLATAGNPLPPPPVPGHEAEQLAKVDIEVSESLIGAVLGPAGRSIIEIQQFSGANIQISKKGMYSPGTRNRIVTVTGPQKAINTAKFLIDLKVQDEESKRQFNAGINIC